MDRSDRSPRILSAVAAGAATLLAGYGRHLYLTGYLKGRKDAFDELEKLERRVRRSR